MHRHEPPGRQQAIKREFQKMVTKESRPGQDRRRERSPSEPLIPVCYQGRGLTGRLVDAAALGVEHRFLEQIFSPVMGEKAQRKVGRRHGLRRTKTAKRSFCRGDNSRMVGQHTQRKTHGSKPGSLEIMVGDEGRQASHHRVPLSSPWARALAYPTTRTGKL